MQGKITLVTSPDFFENSNDSVLFMHLNDEEQASISIWLKNTDIKDNINFYLYSGEDDIPWLFYAMGICKHKYINIDGYTDITKTLSSYILSKSDVHYKTNDDTLAKIYSYINHNRIINIEQFLENTFSDHTTKS
jgi:hypothetical protein